MSWWIVVGASWLKWRRESHRVILSSAVLLTIRLWLLLCRPLAGEGVVVGESLNRGDDMVIVSGVTIGK